MAESREATREAEPLARPGAVGRGPLLWMIPPLLAGYTLAAVCPNVSVRYLLAVTLPLIPATIALAWRGPKTEFRQSLSFGFWGACYLLAGSLLAWAWAIVRLPAPPAAWEGLPPREATLTLRVTRVFATRPGEGNAAGLAEVVATPVVMTELRGRNIYYRARLREGETAPAKGALVEATGLLQYLPPPAPDTAATPGAAANQRFNGYLQGQGVWFSLTRWLRWREVSAPAGWLRWENAQQVKIETWLRHGPAGWEERYGNAYVAMLLGNTALLDQAQREAFTLTGVMHLFAISGLHVAVLAGVLWWCLRRIPKLPRIAGDVLTLAVLWLYVEITGGAPSARRAALMFTFYLAAGWLGRPRAALPAILAAGVLTLLVQPSTLWSPGFQLSYAVVLGLIFYAPPLLVLAQARLRLWPDLPEMGQPPWRQCARWLWGEVIVMFALSWTALLCSAPLTAQYFGVFSPGGLLLNLLLIPLSCIVICAGGVAVLAGLVGFPPFTWLGWLANAVGLGCTGLMDFLARATQDAPGVYARLQLHPDWAGLVAAVGVLAVMIAALPRTRAPRVWYYLLPVGVLLVAAAWAARPA